MGGIDLRFRFLQFRVWCLRLWVQTVEFWVED